MVQVPAVVKVVKEHDPEPEERVPVQVAVLEPSLAVTVTEPVGVPLPVTLKDTVTVCPMVDGFGDDVSVVVEVALVAVMLVTTCGAALKLPLPA